MAGFFLKFKLEEKKSINGGNEPIVIADGIVIGNINDINANDIASLEILKRCHSAIHI
jgi:hypothetical protein